MPFFGHTTHMPCLSKICNEADITNDKLNATVRVALSQFSNSGMRTMKDHLLSQVLKLLGRQSEMLFGQLILTVCSADLLIAP